MKKSAKLKKKRRKYGVSSGTTQKWWCVAIETARKYKRTPIERLKVGTNTISSDC